MTRLREPLLLCACGRAYYERAASRPPGGRWRGHLIGPCRHPLWRATYVHPSTRRRLRPYASQGAL